MDRGWIRVNLIFTWIFMLVNREACSINGLGRNEPYFYIRKYVRE